METWKHLMKIPGKELHKVFSSIRLSVRKAVVLFCQAHRRWRQQEEDPKKAHPVQVNSAVFPVCYTSRLWGTSTPAVKIFFPLLDMLNCVNVSQLYMLLVPWLFSCVEQHYLPQPADGFPCGFIPEYSGSSSKKLNRTCPDKEFVTGKETFILKFHNNDQFWDKRAPDQLS